MLGAAGRPRWSRRELAEASPEVIAAARWELFASRLWPAGLESQLQQPDQPSKTWRTNQKTQGRILISKLRKLLLPPDGPQDEGLG